MSGNRHANNNIKNEVEMKTKIFNNPAKPDPIGFLGFLAEKIIMNPINVIAAFLLSIFMSIAALFFGWRK
ncbi:MAG: hypothetical protein V1684_00505 [bacterium]